MGGGVLGGVLEGFPTVDFFRFISVCSSILILTHMGGVKSAAPPCDTICSAILDSLALGPGGIDRGGPGEAEYGHEGRHARSLTTVHPLCCHDSITYFGGQKIPFDPCLM